MKIRIGTIRALSITIALIGGLAGTVSAQPATPRIADRPKPTPTPNKRPELPKRKIAPTVFAAPNVSFHFGGGTYEKSIAVDPRIAVSLCVTEGSVKINGWSRDELRVFIKDGSRVGFSIQEKSPKSGKPAWVIVTDFDPKKPLAQKECIWGGNVEIDVPTGAAIHIKGEATQIVADSVRKVTVNNTGGDISIRNITEGVDATTYQGNVEVENSNGMISLDTTSGNILAFESGPSQVGDIFKARTNNGRISLQNVEHRQVNVNSISGSVLFTGSLQDHGIYDIKTTNGSLSLVIPVDSTCFFSATFMEGHFSSELPFKLLTEDITPGPVKSIKGTFGKGDCKLNLSNSNGAIRIRKP